MVGMYVLVNHWYEYYAGSPQFNEGMARACPYAYWGIVSERNLSTLLQNVR